MLRIVACLAVAACGAACIPWPHRVITRPELTVNVFDPSGKPVSGAQVVLVAQSAYPRIPHEVSREQADPSGQARFAQDSYISWFIFMHGDFTPSFFVAAWAQGFLSAAIPVEKPYDASELGLVLQHEPKDARATQPRNPADIVGAVDRLERERQRGPGYSGRCPIVWTEPRALFQAPFLVGPAYVTQVRRRSDLERAGFATYQETFQLEFPDVGPYVADSDFPTRIQVGDRVWVCIDTSVEPPDAGIRYIMPIDS